jgi:hypothetical protein
LNQSGLYRCASSFKTEFWGVFGALGGPRSDAPFLFAYLLMVPYRSDIQLLPLCCVLGQQKRHNDTNEIGSRSEILNINKFNPNKCK